MRTVFSPEAIRAANLWRFLLLLVVLTAGASPTPLKPLLAASGPSREAVTSAPRKLMVGTKEAPPFSLKDEKGRWTGISIDLWRQIAAELNLTYEFQELEQKQLLAGLADGSLDVVLENLTITPERLDEFDFTYPFYTTGLGIAVPLQENKKPVIAVIKQLFSSRDVLRVLIVILLILLIVGFLVWLFERKANSAHFGGNAVKGIGSGVWFAAVTMTTVGYGDLHPKTTGGRSVALIWMFIAVIFVSLFTATITSMLTANRLETSVRGLEDLKKELVGTLPDTTSESFLKKNLIAVQAYKSVPEGLAALMDGKIKAFLYDIPELRYRIRQQFPGKIEVLPQVYSQENYGIAFRNNSSLRKNLNRVLLQKIRQQEWQETLYRYLGG